jgi:chromosomal replication initiation ATPase DnaA
MEISAKEMNIVFQAMQLAREYVRKNTGLRIDVSINTIEVHGTPQKMMDIIAEAIEEDKERYNDRTKQRRSVELRAIAAMLIKDTYRTKHEDIAKLFGEPHYDHSSVSNMLNTGRDLLESGDQNFTTKYQKAQREVMLWLKD